jgi:hypothetical protein
MLDYGERLVEGVQQSPPLLVLGRAAKALCMVYQPVPFDQQCSGAPDNARA